MKKYIISSLVLTALLSGIVYAEGTATSTSKIDQLKQEVLDTLQKAKAERDQAKAALASTTKNLREETRTILEIRIGKKLDQQKLKVANVFEKAIQNEKDLITRIESRIAKMEATGINASSSKALLEIAKTKLALADTELTNLGNLLAQNIPASTSTSTSDRKAILQSIKTQSDKTKTAIKTAHAAIVDVITSLKKGQMKEKNSTSTKEINSTSTNN